MKPYLLLSVFLLAISLCPLSQAQTSNLIVVDTIVEVKATGTAIHNNHLYLHSYDGPLDIYSLANPANPLFLNSVDVGWASFKGLLGHHNDKLFVYDNGYHFLRMVDISDPVNPFITDSVPISRSANALRQPTMAHTESHTYVADGDSLFVINTVDSSNIFMENILPSPQFGSYGYGELAVFDTTLYVTNGSTVQVFNISNPGQPDYWTSFSPYVTSSQVNVWHLQINSKDSLLYLGDWNIGHGHQAFDISNPMFPQFQWRAPGSTTHNHIEYDENLIVQTIQNGGICAFYTDKDSSLVLDTLRSTFSPYIFDINLLNNYIYMTSDNGIEVVYLDTNYIPLAVKNDWNLGLELTLYPNPAHDFVQVTSKSSLEAAELELWSLGGQLIRKVPVAPQAKSTSVDLRNLAKGSYWIGLVQNGQRLAGKMVVKH